MVLCQKCTGRQLEKSSMNFPVPRLMASVATHILTRQPLHNQQPRVEDFGYSLPSTAAIILDPEFGGFIPFLGRVLRIFATGILLLLLSCASYGIFYRTIIPPALASRPLYLDYYYAGETVVSNSTKQRPIFSDRFHDSRPSPWTFVDLFAKHNSWEALDAEVQPPLWVEDRVLSPRRAYFVEVALTLPESPLNQQYGMFAVVIELSSNSTVLAIARRSARMPYSSIWINTIGKILKIIPLLVGAIEESRVVVIPAFRHFVESPTSPLRYVSIKIVSHFFNHSAIVEITGGEVRVGVELSQFQEMLKNWFFTCCTIGTSVFLVIYLLLGSLLGCILDRNVPRSTDYYDDPFCELDLNDLAFDNDAEPHDQPSVHDRVDAVHHQDGEESEWEDLYFDANVEFDQTKESLSSCS